MVVVSLVLLGLAAFDLVKSGFRTLPIGLIFLGTLGFVMALLRPDERGRTVSTAKVGSGSREDSTLLERRWPIAGGHPRLRVWMCFGALTLSSLSFQVAFAKLAFSAETTKGLVVIASAVTFAVSCMGPTVKTILGSEARMILKTVGLSRLATTVGAPSVS